MNASHSLGERWSFWVAAAVIVHTLWTSAAPAVTYPLYAAQWHLTHTVTTAIFAVYPVAVVVALLLFGNLSDHIGRRTTILLGLAASLLGVLHSQIGVNLIGPTIATQEALKHFPKEGGRVINVSSVASTRPLPGLSVYSATKSGLNALARAWAAELGPKGITVNAVSPGPVDTEMFRSAGIDENAKNFMISRTPLGRIGVPSDIADVVAFLASPGARWVTGQVIEASGGFVP
jgi:NAD(P)-dependent dehydrogenase (short-subunit alcohol dehydrogenase family)